MIEKLEMFLAMGRMLRIYYASLEIILMIKEVGCSTRMFKHLPKQLMN